MNKAVFWDFDGTLVNSVSLWSNSLLCALKECWPECPCALEDVRPHLRTGFPWHTPQADLSNVKGEAWWDFMHKHFEHVCLALGAAPAAAYQAARKVRSVLLEPGNYTLYEDTHAALQAAAGLGFSQYVVSNNHPDLKQMIDTLGLNTYFSGVIVSGEIGFDKPRKEIYDDALAMAGHPDLCYMIGDNPYADGEGANNAGITPLIVHQKKPVVEFLCFDTLLDAVSHIQEV